MASETESSLSRAWLVLVADTVEGVKSADDNTAVPGVADQ